MSDLHMELWDNSRYLKANELEAKGDVLVLGGDTFYHLDIRVNSDGNIEDWPQTPDYTDFIENGKHPETIRSNRWHQVRKAIYSLSSLQLDTNELAILRTAFFNPEIIEIIVKEPESKGQKQ